MEGSSCEGHEGTIRFSHLLGEWSFLSREADHDLYRVVAWEWLSSPLNDTTVSVEVDVGEDVLQFSLSASAAFP